MTFLDAARQVLEAAGKPLHYEDIAARALQAKLVVTNGATPAATMGSRLYSDTKEGGSSLFVRVGEGRFDLARRRPQGIEDEVDSINRATRVQLGELLTKIPAKRFETLIMELLIAMGFDEATVEVTPYSGDGGVDVRGLFRASGLTNIRAAVQVKRWKGNVSAPTVRELRGSIHAGELGTIITTSGFTASAREEAAAFGKTPIGLISGEELVSLLLKHHVGVIDKTLVVSALDDEFWAELLPPPSTPLEPLQAEPLPVEALPTPPVTPVLPVPPPNLNKPSAYLLFEASTPFTTWKAFALHVVAELHRRHTDSFAAVAETMKGKKRIYLSRDPETLFSAAAIGESGWWLDDNRSGSGLEQMCRQMLRAFGYPADALTLVMHTASHP